MTQGASPPHGEGAIRLDFDAGGRLVGLAVARASRVLPAAALPPAAPLPQR